MMTVMTPLLQGQQRQLDDYPSLTTAEMPLQLGENCHCNNGIDACASTARTPSQRGQQRHLDDGEYAISLMMTKMPLQQGQQC
jgi:hypothetical protein